MSGGSIDQLHRSTLGVYESLVDQFNPSLQRLVALGHTYVKAFQALTSTSEEYFYALSQMGEQALHTLSSRSIGDVIIQIADSQKRLTNELEGMFRRFHGEVLKEMNNNVQLDKEFITGSRRRYEMEVRNQFSALEMQRRRGGGYEDEYIHFLRESQKEALKEEERRYRFLAEKHCNFSLQIAQLMNKTGGTLQHKAEDWMDRVNKTRDPRPRTPSRMEQGPMQVGMREEERNQRGTGREEPALGRVPSRGPSPQPIRSRSGSLGDALSGGRPMRAVVSHPATNPTMLEFYKGDTITVLVPEPRNGWLYGKSQNGTSQGWFPAAYVEPLEQASRPQFSNTSQRSGHSMNNLLDQSGGGRQAAPPPPAPPIPSGGIPTPTVERRAEKKQKPKSNQSMGKPELFPKGTNPFATVKLKPTVTNDRSAPRV